MRYKLFKESSRENNIRDLQSTITPTMMVSDTFEIDDNETNIVLSDDKKENVIFLREISGLIVSYSWFRKESN